MRIISLVLWIVTVAALAIVLWAWFTADVSVKGLDTSYASRQLPSQLWRKAVEDEKLRHEEAIKRINAMPNDPP